MLLVVSDSCLLPNPVSGTSEAGQGSESEDKAEGCREGNTSPRGTVPPVPNQENRSRMGTVTGGRQEPSNGQTSAGLGHQWLNPWNGEKVYSRP